MPLGARSKSIIIIESIILNIYRFLIAGTVDGVYVLPCKETGWYICYDKNNICQFYLKSFTGLKKLNYSFFSFEKTLIKILFVCYWL